MKKEEEEGQEGKEGKGEEEEEKEEKKMNRKNNVYIQKYLCGSECDVYLVGSYWIC